MFSFNEDQLAKQMNDVKNTVLNALGHAKYISKEEFDDLSDRLIITLTKPEWFSQEDKNSNGNYKITASFRNQFPDNINDETEDKGDKDD